VAVARLLMRARFGIFSIDEERSLTAPL